MSGTGVRDAPLAAASQARPWLDKYPNGVVWNATYAPAPVFSLLDRAAKEHGHATCTNFRGRKETYAEIARLVDTATLGLQRLGVTKGTNVGLFLPNTPTFIVYYFAILKAGGTVVNFNPLYTEEELAFQIRDSETEIMITLDLKILFDKIETLLISRVLRQAVVASFPALLPATQAALYRLLKSRDLARPLVSAAAEQIVLERDVLDNDGAFRPVPIDPSADIAVLQYTGGTTGTPKGAMLTHANVHANVMQLIDWVPGLGDAHERVLGILPFFHVFAMTVVMNFGIAKAAELLIMPRFSLDEVLALMSRSRPSVMPGVPTLFNAILHHPKAEGMDFTSLKFCLSGGAPLPIEVKRGFEALTGCAVIEGYGLSEASPVVTSNPLAGPVKEGSIGMPLPGTDISLRDLADPTREVAAGERGELCVKGPQVMRGYWKKPEETEGQFVGDYLRTGDVAVMDEDGCFFIVDRIKDLIICSGYNVYPRRVEDAIYTHPAVEEVTVIGIKDTYRGEAPKAFIKLKEGRTCSADEMMAHLRPKLSKIELPAAIEFRDALPKTIIGKLSKKELKQEEAKRRSSA